MWVIQRSTCLVPGCGFVGRDLLTKEKPNDSARNIETFPAEEVRICVLLSLP